MKDVVIYQTDHGSIEVTLAQDNVWLTQDQLSELFERERSVITKHIRNIFNEHALERDAVCAKFAHTAKDGKTYSIDHFGLDAVISVGYRVKSREGVKFRQGATGVLKQHLLRGYPLHQKRFENNARELEKTLLLIRKTAERTGIQSSMTWALPPWPFWWRNRTPGTRRS